MPPSQTTEDLLQTTGESPALKYWKDELINKADGTKERYEEYFKEFLAFIGKNPDELIVQRQQDLLNKDIKIQRSIERQFLAFIGKKKQEGYAVATQQIVYASVRSFFEIHYFPLRMRRGDYPKGDCEGVKKATAEAILKILNNGNSRNLITVKPAILFLKDCGLRISDARRLNCDFFLEAMEKSPNVDVIQINVITQKTRLLAKTFIGKEAIDALKDYLEARKEGSRNVRAETISKDSPLFKSWTRGKVRARSSSHLRTSVFANISIFNLRRKEEIISFKTFYGSNT